MCGLVAIFDSAGRRAIDGATLARAMLSASNPDFFSPAEQPRFERLRVATQWRR